MHGFYNVNQIICWFQHKLPWYFLLDRTHSQYIAYALKISYTEHKLNISTLSFVAQWICKYYARTWNKSFCSTIFGENFILFLVSENWLLWPQYYRDVFIVHCTGGHVWSHHRWHWIIPHTVGEGNFWIHTIIKKKKPQLNKQCGIMRQSFEGFGIVYDFDLNTQRKKNRDDIAYLKAMQRYRHNGDKRKKCDFIFTLGSTR